MVEIDAQEFERVPAVGAARAVAGARAGKCSNAKIPESLAAAKAEPVPLQDLTAAVFGLSPVVAGAARVPD
jgi:hypothetical protein